MGYRFSTNSVLAVDSYNASLSNGDELWLRARAITERIKLLNHLRATVEAAVDKCLRIYFVPHYRIGRTGRSAKLGYNVILVKGATITFSPKAMHPAHTITGPTFAHAILTTHRLIA